MLTTKKQLKKLAEYFVNQDNERSEYIDWCNEHSKDITNIKNDHPFMTALLILDTNLE